MMFVAHYRDGSAYQSNAEDQSVQDPSKSAWYDIREKPIKPEADLVRFTLIAPLQLMPNVVAVDLTDGHMEINGMRLALTCPIDDALAPEMPLKLVYRKRCALSSSGQRAVFHVIGFKRGDTEHVIFV